MFYKISGFRLKFQAACMQVAVILPFMRLGEVILREKHLPLSPVSLKDIIFNHPGESFDIVPFTYTPATWRQRPGHVTNDDSACSGWCAQSKVLLNCGKWVVRASNFRARNMVSLQAMHLED